MIKTNLQITIAFTDESAHKANITIHTYEKETGKDNSWSTLSFDFGLDDTSPKSLERFWLEIQESVNDSLKDCWKKVQKEK